MQVDFADSLQLEFAVLSDALGGPGAVARLPILDMGQGRVFTDYIDFLQPEDMSAPIMIGVDCGSRKFVAIRLRQDDGSKFVLTLFQRYTGEGIWAWGSSNRSGLFDKLISNDLRLGDHEPAKCAWVVQLLRQGSVGAVTVE